MRYALLAYGNTDVMQQRSAAEQAEIRARIAQLLERPSITGWVRLQSAGSATTVRHEQGRTLLTDGPFVDSKDFLGGMILIEAADLDEALAIAAELQEPQGGGAIEVRPVREEPLTDA